MKNTTYGTNQQSVSGVGAASDVNLTLRNIQDHAIANDGSTDKRRRKYEFGWWTRGLPRVIEERAEIRHRQGTSYAAYVGAKMVELGYSLQEIKAWAANVENWRCSRRYEKPKGSGGDTWLDMPIPADFQERAIAAARGAASHG